MFWRSFFFACSLAFRFLASCLSWATLFLASFAVDDSGCFPPTFWKWMALPFTTELRSVAKLATWLSRLLVISQRVCRLCVSCWCFARAVVIEVLQSPLAFLMALSSLRAMARSYNYHPTSHSQPRVRAHSCCNHIWLGCAVFSEPLVALLHSFNRPLSKISCFSMIPWKHYRWMGLAFY